MNIKTYTVVAFALTLCSCGLLDGTTNSCEPDTIEPTGDLSVDILGTWVGCIPGPDGTAPYCDFRRDGRLVLLGRKRPGETSDLGRTPAEGEVVTWTYEVTDDKLTVYSKNGSIYIYRHRAMGIYPTSIHFTPSGMSMGRVSCQGPAFDQER
jgi:hypothetical protein